MKKSDKRLIEDGPRRTGWLWAFNELALRGRYIKELGNFSTPSGGWKKIGAPRPEYAKEAETLSDLLVAVAGLRYLGTPDTIREKIKDTQNVLAYNREMEWMPENERDKISTPLEALEQRLRYIYTRAVVAEDLLQKSGWRFNPSTRKASRIAAGAADLLGECVWHIYNEKYADKGNTFDTRRKISRALTPYFEESELSEKSGALIYNAIYNRERSPK